MKKIKLLFVFLLLIIGKIHAQEDTSLGSQNINMQKDPCARTVHTVYRMNYGNGIDLQFGLNPKNIKGLAMLIGIKFLSDTANSDLTREKSGYEFGIPTIGIAYIRSFKDFIKPMAFSLHLTYVMGARKYNFLEPAIGLGYVLSNYVIFNLNATFRLKDRISSGVGVIVFM